MNKYKIQHRITALSHCAVIEKDKFTTSFISDGITFSHWDFNHRDGWLTDYWLAEETVGSNNFVEAIKVSKQKLSKIIPRISLISQSYIEFIYEPFLVHKVGDDIAFFHYIEDSKGVGLMFTEKECKALGLLLDNDLISNEFYFYWNDAVNTIGYSSKLLVMFSALEALAKQRDTKKFKGKYNLYDFILGEELRKKIFEKNTGLRHRLVHGEYLGEDDIKINYVDVVHKKIIIYFNDIIFNEKILSEDVVSPQRNLFYNKSELRTFIKSDNIKNFDLKILLEDYKENGYNNPKKCSNYFEKGIESRY